MRAGTQSGRSAVRLRRRWQTWATLPGSLMLAIALAACSAGDDGERAAAVGTVVLAVGTPATPLGAPGATPAVAGSPVSGSPAAAGTPGAAGFRVAGAEGGAVVWATAVDPTTRAPVDRVAAFRADAPVLYAAIPLARLEPGSVLTATWFYNRTPLAGLLGSVTASAGATARDTWVAFDLARAPDQPWPAGTYAVQVAVNGAPVLSGEVEVQAPA